MLAKTILELLIHKTLRMPWRNVNYSSYIISLKATDFRLNKSAESCQCKLTFKTFFIHKLDASFGSECANIQLNQVCFFTYMQLNETNNRL